MTPAAPARATLRTGRAARWHPIGIGWAGPTIVAGGSREQQRRWLPGILDSSDEWSPTGTADQIAKFLHPYVVAGATNLSLAPCGRDRAIEIEAVARVKQLLAPET